MELLAWIGVAIAMAWYLMTTEEARVQLHLLFVWLVMFAATVGWIIWLLLRPTLPP